MQGRKCGIARGGAAVVAMSFGLAGGAAWACPPGEGLEEGSGFLPARVELIRHDVAGERASTYVLMVTPDHEVKVVGEGDDIRVFIDGDRAPEDRVQTFDGGMKVLNEQGDVITVVHVREDGTIGVSGGGGEGDAVRLSRVEAFPALVAGQARALAPSGTLRGFSVRQEVEGEPRVMLGVTLTDVPGELGERLGLAAGGGVLLSHVSESLPAGKAGLKANDVIVSIDGQTPATRSLLLETLGERQPGDVLPLVVRRGEESLEIGVKLEAFDRGRLRGSLGTVGSGGAGGAMAPRAELLEQERRTAELRSRLTELSAQTAALAAQQSEASGDEAARLADEVAAVSREMAEVAGQLAVESARSGGQGFFAWTAPSAPGAAGGGASAIIQLEDQLGRNLLVRPGLIDQDVEALVERLARVYEQSSAGQGSIAEHVQRALEAQREPLADLGEHQQALVERLREIEKRLGDTARWHDEFGPEVRARTESMMQRLEEIERRMDTIEGRLDDRLANLERMLERALEGRDRR